jgi:hypothetical protein
VSLLACLIQAIGNDQGRHLSALLAGVISYISRSCSIRKDFVLFIRLRCTFILLSQNFALLFG